MPEYDMTCHLTLYHGMLIIEIEAEITEIEVLKGSISRSEVPFLTALSYRMRSRLAAEFLGMTLYNLVSCGAVRKFLRSAPLSSSNLMNPTLSLIMEKNRREFSSSVYKSNPYKSNTYKSNTYQSNLYKSNPYKSNPYKSNPYKSNTYQSNSEKSNPYKSNPYKSNPYKSNPYRSNPYKSNP